MLLFGIFKNKRKSDDLDQTLINWPDHVIILDENNFEKFIKSYPFSVIDFWAPWCGPCKAMAPRLRRLSKVYNGRVAFGKINVQDNQKISKKYKILGIPHLGFFRYGKKISESTGLKSLGNIKDIIDDMLKNV